MTDREHVMNQAGKILRSCTILIVLFVSFELRISNERFCELSQVISKPTGLDYTKPNLKPLLCDFLVYKHHLLIDNRT